MKLRSKVILVALIPTLILTVTLSAVSIAVLYRLAHEEMEQVRQLLLKERSASLEHHVQMDVSSVKSIYDESGDSDIEARNRAVQVLRKLTYDKQGYFFGYDRDNIRLFWADKDIDIGVSFNDVKNANGVFAIRELNLLARSGKHSSLRVACS
ncbi:cache domain-containing protein [Pseudomonas fluorescens]|uniref:cache domain-containing protein n=1 Tax=Pseudomonas fluorescens TaxID=294 RepID=UPI00398FB75B